MLGCMAVLGTHLASPHVNEVWRCGGVNEGTKIGAGIADVKQSLSIATRMVKTAGQQQAALKLCQEGWPVLCFWRRFLITCKVKYSRSKLRGFLELEVCFKK